MFCATATLKGDNPSYGIMATKRKTSKTTEEKEEEEKSGEDSSEEESESSSSRSRGKATHAVTVQSLHVKADDPDSTYMREDITVKGSGDGKALLKECLEECHRADDKIPDGASAYVIQIDEAGTGDTILQRKVEGVESAREAIDHVIADLDKPAKKGRGK